jgi:uncharacterized protein
MNNHHGNVTNTTYNTTIFIHSGSDMQEINKWSEQLTSILQQIPSKADSLKPMIQFLVTTLSPAKIYMLNHDNENGNSDYIDFFIVISGKTGVRFTELEPILNIAYLKDQRVSCSLHSQGNVLEGLKSGHIFYSLNFISENLVYDNKVLEYPVTSTEALQTMKQQTAKKFKGYYDKAIAFYECAVSLNENRSTSVTLFMLHQATELILRGILISLNGYDKKTHEIRALKKYIRRCAQPLNNYLPDTTETEKRVLDILDKAYLSSRYEDNYVTGDEDNTYLFEKIKQLLTFSKAYVEKRLQIK